MFGSLYRRLTDIHGTGFGCLHVVNYLDPTASSSDASGLHGVGAWYPGYGSTPSPQAQAAGPAACPRSLSHRKKVGRVRTKVEYEAAVRLCGCAAVTSSRGGGAGSRTGRSRRARDRAAADECWKPRCGTSPQARTELAHGITARLIHGLHDEWAADPCLEFIQNFSMGGHGIGQVSPIFSHRGRDGPIRSVSAMCRNPCA
jgi:hypothetical protein